MEKRIIGGHRSSDHFEHLVKVTVLEISGDKVRLGFEAGEGFPVYRWEVWDRDLRRRQAGSRLISKESTDG